MGLFSKIKDPVSGIAQVVGCDSEPTAALGMPCKMQLVIQSAGGAPFSCEHTFDDVPAGRWPKSGDSLPVTFDRNHTDRMRVDWDQLGVAPAAAVAPQYAPVVPAPTTITPGPAPTIISMGVRTPMQISADSPQAKAAIERAEKMMNMDLDGDGTVAGAPAGPGQKLDVNALMAQAQAAMTQFQQGGGMAAFTAGATPPAAAAPPAKDVVGQLEELANLRDRGALTDAEFETQKQRILAGG